MTFAPATIAPFGTSSLSFTINNPNGVSLTSVGFNDTLPAGLTLAFPNGLTGSCGGTITAPAGSNSVSLSGATIAASGSCTFSVNVTGINFGTYTNATGPLVSANGGYSLGASAILAIINPTGAVVPSNGQVTPSLINLVDYIADNGTSILSGSFKVTSTDGRPYTISGGAPWMSIVQIGDTVNVSLIRSAIVNSEVTVVNLTFTFGDGTSLIGQVALHSIAPTQFVTLSGSSSLTFTGIAGSAAQTQPLTILAAGSPLTPQVTAATSSGGNWLSVSGGGGSTPLPLTVTADPGNLSPGTYHGSITISSTAAGTNPLVIAVTFIVN
jgi:hypothetical protein